jgi:hypothetical protein
LLLADELMIFFFEMKDKLMMIVGCSNTSFTFSQLFLNPVAFGAFVQIGMWYGS